MRLVCPNCGAQYEVPDNVIPQGGRDVQCSNCGHTWFQPHPDDDPALAEELDQPMLEESWQEDAEALDDALSSDLPNPAEDDAIATPEPADSWDEPDDRQPGAPLQPAPAAEEDYDDDYEAWDDDPPLNAELPPRKPVDPDVADLLREEAEREARQRAAERSTLETQPELGLSTEDEAQRRQREAQERMARLRGNVPVPETDPASAEISPEALAATAASATRRDLLPDIDEINSTLRSTSERRPAAADDHDRPGDAPAPPAPQPRTGFSRGLRLALLLAIVALVLYITAPQIGRAIPTLEPATSGYSGAIDDMRLWLDGQMRALLAWLDGMSSEAAPPPADQ